MSEPDAEPARGGGAGTWRLMRQDDNGNKYVVGAFANLVAAEKARAEFEARGHKQIYWVEDAGSAGLPPQSVPNTVTPE